MKNSLIPKKHIVPGKDYWCEYNDYRILHLMKYTGYGLFKGQDISAEIQNVRVMFEGYVNINRSRIPRAYLVPKRYYWCRYKEENDLKLMRYENDKSLYFISYDFHLPSTDVKVIFEDYEN